MRREASTSQRSLDALARRTCILAPLADTLDRGMDRQLEALLDELAPFGPAPLCPTIGVFQALDLIELWDGVKALFGAVPICHWGIAWPAGVALARVLLDSPDRVRGLHVVDVGAGGGIAAIAAAKAGAARVIAADVDPLALRVTRLAAERNGVKLELLEADVGAVNLAARPDVVLASDLEYEMSGAQARDRLEALVPLGTTLLLADPGRPCFTSRGLELLATFRLSDVAPVYALEDRDEALRQEDQFARVFEGDVRVYARRPPPT
jgi:predicted nicotinamide N-methyase